MKGTEKTAAETVARLLRVLVNHSDTMLKALKKCDNVTTIKQYLSIAERFGNNFDVMAEKNLLFRDFKGLENVIDVDSSALCFTYKFNAIGEIDDSFCVVTICGTSSENPSISIKIPKDDERTYIQFYSQMLERDGIDKLCKQEEIGESVKKELDLLADAIKNARPDKPKSNRHDFSEQSGIPKNYSNERWIITNCSEVWGAFEMILKGGNFSDLGMVAFYNLEGKKVCIMNLAIIAVRFFLIN